MKLVVKENINKVAEPTKKVWTAVINSVDGYGKIPYSIGQAKGDIIVFRGSSDAVRFPKSSSDGKVLGTDSTTATGLAWVSVGGGGTSANLRNGAGVEVKAGTIVYVNSSNGTFQKASSKTITERYFIVSETCASGNYVDCYSADGATVNILCDTVAVAIGDGISVSSSLTGYGTKDDNAILGKAVTAKASGSTGTVKCILNQRIGKLALCKNIESSTLAKGAVCKIIPTDNSTIEVKKCTWNVPADSIVMQSITASATGLMAQNGNTVDVLCSTKDVQKGDWLIPSSTAGQAEYGNGYGIGRALESKASGSTGLVSCYLNLGGYGLTHRAWWLVDGITSANVIAAYLFKGASSETQALQDLSGHGDDLKLYKTGGVTWSTNTGFYIPRAQVGLCNAYLISHYSSIASIGYSFTGEGHGGFYIKDTCKRLMLSPGSYIGTIGSRSGGYYHSTGTPSSGVLSGNFRNDSNLQVCYNGVYKAAISGGNTDSYLPSDETIIGGTYWSAVSATDAAYSHIFYVKALVLYNTDLTSTQHTALYEKINALG